MIDSIQLVNRVTKQAQVVDQDQSKFVLTQLDLGSVTANHNTSNYYDQIGVTLDSTSIEARMISITGWVIGSDREELGKNKAALNRLINPLQDLDIIVYDTYVLTCRPDYSIRYGKTVKENNDYMCKFLIQGTCGSPLFTTVNEEVVTLSLIKNKPLFPLTIPGLSGIILGEKTANSSVSIYNPGDFPAGLVITIQAAGEVANPVITLVNTQESIKLNKTLVSGEEVIISTVSGSKKIRGILNSVESNYIQYLSYPSTWIQLEPGENSVQYSADSGAADMQVLISFYPTYMEVET